MKKIFSYTLITLLTINIFAPIGLSISLSDGIQIKENKAYADNCTVVSAIWSPGGQQSKSTFYRDGKTAANIIVKTKDCVNEPNITLTVFELDSCIQNCDDGLSDSHLQRRLITVPSDNFTIRLRLGEEECEGGLSGAIGYDCDLFFYIRQNDNVLFNSWSGPENEGQLLYECDGLCFDNAALLSVVSNGTDDKPIDLTKDQQSALAPDVYTLLAPIGNINCVSSDGLDKDGKPNCIVGNGIGYYLNAIFLLAIGLCGALAVVMIIISAIQYMGDESVFGKTEAKGKILSAILGLLIALGSYALLNTINPDLTGKNGVTVSQVESDIQSIEAVDASTFTTITGKKVLSPSEYDAMGRKVAKQVGIPFCAIKVILERESKGNPGAIGFDENVRNTAIPSRIAFVNSGKKYSGETFASSPTLITQKGFVNQSKNNVTNTPGLGIDWRFSKGLGLTQITLFPPGYFSSGYKSNPPGLDQKDIYPTLNGFTPRDLLDPEKNLTAGATVWKNFWIKCNKNIYGTWSAYGSGSCDGGSAFIKKEATVRTEYYNGCPEADKNI